MEQKVQEGRIQSLCLNWDTHILLPSPALRPKEVFGLRMNYTQAFLVPQLADSGLWDFSISVIS